VTKSEERNKDKQDPTDDNRWDSKDLRDTGIVAGLILLFKQLVTIFPDLLRAFNERRRVRIDEEQWEIVKTELLDKAKDKERKEKETLIASNGEGNHQ